MYARFGVRALSMTGQSVETIIKHYLDPEQQLSAAASVSLDKLEEYTIKKKKMEALDD